MITLFCIFLVIAMIIGIVELFGMMIAVAFRLVPFLFSVGLVIAVICVVGYALGIIGAIVAIVIIIAACAGKSHHV